MAGSLGYLEKGRYIHDLVPKVSLELPSLLPLPHFLQDIVHLGSTSINSIAQTRLHANVAVYQMPLITITFAHLPYAGIFGSPYQSL